MENISNNNSPSPAPHPAAQHVLRTCTDLMANQLEIEEARDRLYGTEIVAFLDAALVILGAMFDMAEARASFCDLGVDEYILRGASQSKAGMPATRLAEGVIRLIRERNLADLAEEMDKDEPDMKVVAQLVELLDR